MDWMLIVIGIGLFLTGMIVMAPFAYSDGKRAGRRLAEREIHESIWHNTKNRHSARRFDILDAEILEEVETQK